MIDVTGIDKSGWRRKLCGLSLVGLLLASGCAHQPDSPSLLDLRGDSGRVDKGTIATDPDSVVHIVAPDDHSLFYLQGIAHARDRLFQMDVLRRQAQGRLSELFGKERLREDVQTRQLGLQAAAERSYQALTPRLKALLDAYVAGVNHVIKHTEAKSPGAEGERAVSDLSQSPSFTLPLEYLQLEIAQIEPWRASDSLIILKMMAAHLGLQIDTDSTQHYKAYVAAGQQHGFDGTALFFEDLQRVQPMTQRSTIQDSSTISSRSHQRYYEESSVVRWDETGQLIDERSRTRSSLSTTPSNEIAKSRGIGRAESVDAEGVGSMNQMLALVAQSFDQIPWLGNANRPGVEFLGSNLWGVTAEHSTTGSPIIANDPHLMLTFPAIFYEWHLQVVPQAGNNADPEMNVSGVGFPGLPMVVQGQNRDISWGSTNNPVDVSDVFLDTLVVGNSACQSRSGICIYSEESYHPVEVVDETFWVNIPDDGQMDNLQIAELPPESRRRLFVPFRSFGPIINVSDPEELKREQGSTTALTLQYAGFHGTKELETFYAWARAKDLEQYQAALSDFSVGSQNWIYMDRQGNLAYLTGADIPLRRDLELEKKVSAPLTLVRDGKGSQNWIRDPMYQQGQSIPYKVLGRDELPKIVNPSSGIIVNANNDPLGTTLDNNPYNQVRNPTQGIYYIQSEYADGLRAASIYRALQNKIGQGKKVSPAFMQVLQGDSKQFDAQLLLPYLLAAFRDSLEPGAPKALKQFPLSEKMREAVYYLQDWDYSTPTGLQEGYDQFDDYGVRASKISQQEIRASVAATIYNVWRAKLIANSVDRVVEQYKLPQLPHRYALKSVYNLLSKEPFTGVGRSGLDFFTFKESSRLEAVQKRDYLVLKSFSEALESLASDDFAKAFKHSKDISTYRWGKLHLAMVKDPMQRVLSMDGKELVAKTEERAGIPRDGGYEVINASGFSARANRSEAFAFDVGAARRYIGFVYPPTLLSGERKRPTKHKQREIVGFSIYPGFSNARDVVESERERQLRQLKLWLTVDYHSVKMDLSDINRSRSAGWTIRDFDISNMGISQGTSDPVSQ